MRGEDAQKPVERVRKSLILGTALLRLLCSAHRPSGTRSRTRGVCALCLCVVITQKTRSAMCAHAFFSRPQPLIRTLKGRSEREVYVRNLDACRAHVVKKYVRAAIVVV